MVIPSWIFFLVALWVIAFGLYRIRVALKRPAQLEEPDRPNFMRRGLYSQSSRTHVLFGVIYLLLGGCLVGMGFGWQPMGPGGCARERADSSAPPAPAPAQK